MDMSDHTEKQKAIIEHSGGNLLVSAAAGSGKTYNMIRHVLYYLTHPGKDGRYGEIMRLLIVTYTKSAAADMCMKLKKAMDGEIAALEEKMASGGTAEDKALAEHLCRQKILLPGARISTVDSFCSYLVRNYFEQLDISPDVRPADEGELSLLEQDVLDAVFEEKYAEAAPEFIRLLDAFTGEKNDTNLKNSVLKLYDNAQNASDPALWLDSCEWKIPETEEEFFRLEWISGEKNSLLSDAKEKLRLALQLNQAALDCFADADNPYYADLLRSDREKMEVLGSIASLPLLVESARSLRFSTVRMAAGRDPADIESLKSYCGTKSEKSGYRGIIGGIAGDYPNSFVDEFRLARALQEPMHAILELTRAFSAAFGVAKSRKKLASFNDIEHDALRLLRDGDGQRTELAKQLAGSFDEIIVDEYQDINQVQEDILTALSREEDGCPNMFMVGDVKQSIYRFRRAKPDIFLRKFAEYAPEPGPFRKIELSVNYRSRRCVLDTANRICRRLMDVPLGGIAYDDAAALHYHASYEGEDPVPEFWLSETEGNAEEALKQEAAAAALRIRQMLDSGYMIWEKGDEAKKIPAGFRRVAPHDIAILLSAVAGGSGRAFADALKKQGVSAVYTDKHGFFDTEEVQLLLAVLSVLDNPMQDIPLAAVLTSPLFDFTDDELAMLAADYAGVGNCLFDRIQRAFQDHASKNGRIRQFTEWLLQWRRRADRLSVAGTLEAVLRETGLEIYFRSMPAGSQRMANIRQLLELAKSFEKTGYSGIFQFIRFVEREKQLEVDMGEAQDAGAESDAVRIMTIHGSKGLEFSVVILASLQKQFNLRELNEEFLNHEKYGIAFRSVDTERRLKQENLWHIFVHKTLTRAIYSEQLRLLYVALTRAGSRIILSACRKINPEKGEALPPDAAEQDLIRAAEQKYPSLALAPDQPVEPAYLLSARSFLDWIQMVLAKGSLGWKLCAASSDTLGRADAAAAEDTERYRRHLHDLREEGRNAAAGGFERGSAEEKWCRKLQYHYPYEALADKKAVYSVTEILKAQGSAAASPEQGAEAASGLLPERSDGGLSGADLGNAYHKLMEHIPPEEGRNADSAARFIARETENGLFSAEEQAVLRPEAVAAFFVSDIGSRICRAAAEGRLHREQPFLMGRPLGDFYPDLSEDTCGEPVLVQGIIDMYFEEEDGLVLVDYKTNRVRDPEELLAIYGPQLKMYRQALEQASGLPVKECYIYSFRHAVFVPWHGLPSDER